MVNRLVDMEWKFGGENNCTLCTHWSFDRKTLLDDKAKAKRLISAEMCEMHAFQFKMCAFR